MFGILKDFRNSKKASGLLVTLAVELLLFFVPCEGPEKVELRVHLMEIVGLLGGVYMGAQGIADMGKEKAKVDAGITKPNA